MSKSILFLTLFSVLLSGNLLAADLKIGFVDAERVNRESAPADDASKRLEREFQPRGARRLPGLRIS